MSERFDPTKGKTAQRRLDGDERRVVKRRGDEFGKVERTQGRAVGHDGGRVARIVRALGLVVATVRRVAVTRVNEHSGRAKHRYRERPAGRD